MQYDQLKTRKIIIYGASTSAYNMLYLLRGIGITPIGFCITHCSSERYFIEGIRVFEAQEMIPLNKDAHFLVSCRRNDYESIVSAIEKYGGTSYEYAGLDSEIDMYLRKKYFSNIFDYCEMRNRCSDSFMPAVFAAKSHMDKQLKENVNFNGIQYIQAGAARTEKKLADLADNNGDNISVRNNNYSELTAIYWLWKHCDAISDDYIGCCHYRRIFNISKEKMGSCFETGIDMIIPWPGFYAPNVKHAYIKSVPQISYMEEDWECMMRMLKKFAPEYYEFAKRFESDHMYIHYNMMVARRDIFNDWCEFIFTILFGIENYYCEKKIDRDDRYLGFIGETLTTIYVFYNISKYKILPIDTILLS